MSLRSFVKLTLSLLFVPISFILSLIIPKRDLVFLYGSSRQRYDDNTRYVFEALVAKDIDAVWLTEHPDIERYIRELGGTTVSLARPLQLFWALLRAKIMIDSGDGVFDPLWITSLTKTTTISTLHGCGPKVSLSRDTKGKSAVRQIQNLLRFDFVNFPSDYAGEWIGGRVYNLPNEKIINLGYPRTDQLARASHKRAGQRSRKIAKLFRSKVSYKSSIVLYTPTWRTHTYDMPLTYMDGFDIQIFNEWLADKDTYFFLTVHSVNVPEKLPENHSNFYVINSKDWPNFDVSAFMTEVDILINDYATTSVDFAHTGRPQIAFMPDYQLYKREKGFAEEYRDTIVGPEVQTYSELISNLGNALDNPDTFVAPFKVSRDSLIQKYNVVENRPSSERWVAFIQKLLNNE